MSSPFKSREEMIENPFYDEDFSININKKMTIPNKIKAAEGPYLDDPAIVAIQDIHTEMMRVPDCIRVAGGESHITTQREPPLEIKLEDHLFGKPSEEPIQLSTPPRTLRYEDAVPIFAEPIKQLDKALNSTLPSSKNRTMDGSMLRMNDTMVMECEEPELISSQHLLHLRRRILHLSHRIDSLEIENRQRNRRDLFLYAIGALYLLFRGLRWFANSTGTGRHRF